MVIRHKHRHQSASRGLIEKPPGKINASTWRSVWVETDGDCFNLLGAKV